MNSGSSALLIVGHGSTVNQDSDAPTLAHAAEIRRWNIFAQLECAFWKEEPSLRHAIFLFDAESIREVYVVPNFISEGYFTPDQAITLIERLLSTAGAASYPDTAYSITLAELRLRWEWDSLRSDPRFQKILAGPEPKTVF